MVYYQIMLYISITLTGLFLLKWNRYISVSYTVVFLLMPIINIGYLRVAVAESYTEAILANGIVYLCSSFLQLGILSYAFSFCKVRMPRLLSIPLFISNSVIGSMALTTNHHHMLYATSSLVQRDGISYLEKTYGPLHTVFYVMIILYMVLDMAVLLYGFTRRDVSKKNALALLIMYFINIISFFGTKLFQLPVELQPAAYVMTQVVMLILSRRLRMYSISDMAVDVISEEGKTAFVSFDSSRHYLGCSGPAFEYMPELSDLYIDGPLYRDDPRFGRIHEWLDAADGSGKAVEFSAERDDVSCRVIVSCIYIRSKKTGYQLRIEDNTEEQKYIKLLQEARISAESNSRAKGDFLAHMSHEIRTPINAILGMDEMILRESGEESTLEYAEDIRKAGNTLLGIINDVLDFSKIEAGKTDIIPADYSLSSVIADLTNITGPRAEEKGLEFSVEVDPDIPDVLRGDEMRIKQIIMNLLTNAVKYTREGGITLSVGYERTDGGILLKVAVKDTGIGIKQDDIERLFMAFERIDEKKNRSIQGTGLGITITQRLLMLMNSTLEVSSEYGKGSVFSFAIEQGVVNDAPIGDYSEKALRSAESRRKYHESFCAPDAQLLVVDDTEMNLIVFKGLLKRTEVRIDTATSGDEAVRLARKKRYDLMFLDHRMPEKDGIETLKEIRDDEKGMNRGTPAVCLTANAVSGVREQYIAAGFVEYLTKPVIPAKLEETIVKLLPAELIKTPDPGSGSDDGDADGENFGELLDIYIKDVDSMSGTIEDLFDSGDWENYTIKVHALKSTSRLVGETEISELAEKLEKAGDSGDTGFIREHTGELLTMYRAVKEKYGRSGAQPEAGRPEATEELIEQAYDDIREAVSGFDFDTLTAVLDELNTYSIPETHREKISQISKAADNVDWGTLKQLML